MACEDGTLSTQEKMGAWFWTETVDVKSAIIGSRGWKLPRELKNGLGTNRSSDQEKGGDGVKLEELRAIPD